jgi:hypothetical protein
MTARDAGGTAYLVVKRRLRRVGWSAGIPVSQILYCSAPDVLARNLERIKLAIYRALIAAAEFAIKRGDDWVAVLKGYHRVSAKSHFSCSAMAVFGAAVGNRDLFPRQAVERGAQRGLVGLDGQGVVATGVDDGLGGVSWQCGASAVMTASVMSSTPRRVRSTGISLVFAQIAS